LFWAFKVSNERHATKESFPMAKAEAVKDWLGWWSRAKDMRNP